MTNEMIRKCVLVGRTFWHLPPKKGTSCGILLGTAKRFGICGAKHRSHPNASILATPRSSRVTQKGLRGGKGSWGLPEGVGTGVHENMPSSWFFHHQQKVLARHFRRKAPIASDRIDFGYPSIIPSHTKKIARRKGKRGASGGSQSWCVHAYALKSKEKKEFSSRLEDRFDWA